MNDSTSKRSRGRPRGSGIGKHRVFPIWRQDFDRAGFARALLLLAMHLDGEEKKAHKKGRTSHPRNETHDGRDAS